MKKFLNIFVSKKKKLITEENKFQKKNWVWKLSYPQKKLPAHTHLVYAFMDNFILKFKIFF